MATRVTIIKKGGGSLKQDVTNFILPLTNIHLELAGKLTEQAMRVNIKNSLVRPGSTGNLEATIFAERISPLSVGVGNIDALNSNAPYWRAVNYGSDHMVGKQLPKGIFSPGVPIPDRGSFRDGRFYAGATDGSKSYAPVVSKPILAHNYIERTEAQLFRIAERALI